MRSLTINNRDIIDGKLSIELPQDLEELDLSGCTSLTSLPPLPKTLKFLNLNHCKNLVRIKELIEELKNLQDKSDCKITWPEHSNPLMRKVVRQGNRNFKIKKSHQRTFDATTEQLSHPINIIERAEENFGNLLQRLETGEGYFRIEDFFGLPLPHDFPDLEAHANKIFEAHYLQSFAVSSGRQKALRPAELRKQEEVQRLIHGAMHASRVAALIPIMANLYRKYGDKEAQLLSNEDILLAQIAALFHDSARLRDGEDLWDSESGELCYNYLKSQGIKDERARIFSDAIRHKDTPGIKSIIHKLIHDADCADILRLGYEFRIEEMDFYKDIASKNPEALYELENVLLEIRGVIAQQFDLKGDKEAATITLYGSAIQDGEGINATFDPEEKKKYEHANNCFCEVAKNITSFPTLSELNIPIQNEEKKEEEKTPQLKSPKTTKAPEEEKSAAKEEDWLKELENRLRPILSEEEFILFKNLMEMDLFLHHTTKSSIIHDIISDKLTLFPALQDPKEQERWEKKNINNNTLKFGGINENVFFGLSAGMSHFNLPLFLQKKNDQTTILINVKEITKHNPDALRGLWSSGHFYSHDNEIDKTAKKAQNTVVGGTEVSWRHSKNINGEKEFYREIYYKDGDGIRYQRNNLGEEISTGKYLWPSFALRFIEHLRLLGENNPVRQHILTNPQDKNILSAAIEELMPLDLFEMKLPVGILLNQPGVTILYDKTPEEEQIPKNLPHAKILSREEIAEEVNTAAMDGDIESLETFLNKDYPLDGHFYSSLNQPSPLMTAITEGQAETVKWLIKHGANKKYFEQSLISARTYHTKSAINYEKSELLVSALENPGMLEILEENGFKIDSIIFNKGALFAAVKNGDSAMVRIMLEKFPERYNPNTKDQKGYTALHYATLYNYPEIIEILIEADADLNARDKDGNTAIHLAVKKHYFEILQNLLEQEASADIVNNHGYTALHYATLHGIDKAVKIICMDDMPDLDKRTNGDGYTALHIAVAESQMKILENLLKAGANPDIKDENSQTPLHLAAMKGKLDMVKMICGYQTNFNLRDKAEKTALDLAREKGEEEVVEHPQEMIEAREEEMPSNIVANPQTKIPNKEHIKS